MNRLDKIKSEVLKSKLKVIDGSGRSEDGTVKLIWETATEESKAKKMERGSCEYIK